MDKIEQIRAEIERLRKLLPWGGSASQLAMEYNCKNEAYDEILAFIDSLKEIEGTSSKFPMIPQDDMEAYDSEVWEWLKKYGTEENHQLIMMTARHFVDWQKSINSDKNEEKFMGSSDLEEAAKKYEDSLGYYECMNQWPGVAFKAGAE